MGTEEGKEGDSASEIGCCGSGSVSAVCGGDGGGGAEAMYGSWDV